MEVKRLVVELYPNPHYRAYNLEGKIFDFKNSYISDSRLNKATDEEISPEEKQNIEDAIGLFTNIGGVKKISSFSNDSVAIEKGVAFDWDNLDPQIFKVLEQLGELDIYYEFDGVRYSSKEEAMGERDSYRPPRDDRW